MSWNPYESPQSLPPPPPPADSNGIRRGVGLFFWALSALIVVGTLAMLMEFVPLYFSGQHTPRNTNLGLLILRNIVLAVALWFAGRWFRQRGRRPHE